MICIPATFILSIQIAFLSQDLKNASTIYGELKQDGEEFITGEGNWPNLLDKEIGLTLTANLDKNEKILVAHPLNNTGNGRQNVTIMTSIPRTGQSNLREIIKAIKKPNGFLTVSPPRKMNLVIEIPQKDKQKSVADRVSALNFSALIIDHFAFIDFNKYGKEQPIQVSMIRDPVERAISMYYFVRAPFAVVEESNRFPGKNLPGRKFLRKSMESCLTNKTDAECSFVNNSPVMGHTIQYFCGQENFCKLFANEEGLKKAMEVVEKKFAVVGVVEELEKTLVVLENYIPKFFKGAFKAYLELKEKNPNALTNKNMYKPQLEPQFRKVLEQKFSTERKFYNFVKEKLNKQYEKIVERAKIKDFLLLNKGE